MSPGSQSEALLLLLVDCTKHLNLTGVTVSFLVGEVKFFSFFSWIIIDTNSSMVME